MPKASPLQSNFNGGEFSPFLKGRVDNERYGTGLETCLNYIPTIQGALTRRPGTYFVSYVKDGDASTRLLPFQFSVDQAYVIEVGDLYFRFYKNNAAILDSGSPVELVTPYANSDIFQLKISQSADILYITHPDYAPRKLQRFSDTQWTLSTIDFTNGPYLSNDDRGWTLTPGAATGSGVSLVTGPTYSVSTTANSGGLVRITTTAAHGFDTGDKVFISGVGGTTEANGNWTITVVDSTKFTLQGSTYANAFTAGGTVYPGVFQSTDVGRYIRVFQTGVWGYGKIASYTDYAHVTVDITDTFTSTAAKTIWRLGVFSDTTGYPACVTFHEDRLMLGGSPDNPQRVDGSRTGDYENFSPSDADGTVTASHAISATLNSTDVNVIRWFTPDEKGLLAGTVGGEWVVRGATTSEALTPINISAKKSTSYGSADIQPVQVGKATLHVQLSTKKIREFLYFYDVDGFRANDLTLLAEHITKDGVVEMAYMKEPQSIVWIVRSDGALIGMTYERDLDAIRVGWHRHELGGYGDSDQGIPHVESITVIPSSDGTRSELWMVVRRRINGVRVRCVEYMTKFFEDTDDQQDAFFVDCGSTYDNPITVTGITKANPGVVTAASHGLSNGDRVRFYEIHGMTEVNSNSYTVANVTTNTFELSGTDTSSFTTYITDTDLTNGVVRKLVTTLSGLDYLEGESVSILADGAPQPNQTVSGGSITLPLSAGVVQVGFGYNSDAQMLRLEAGSADGTALGKTRRVHRVGFYLHRSLGLKIGTSFDSLDTLVFRTSADPMTRAPALFTGIISETINADYDFENQIAWRQDQPLPSTILAVMPQLHTQDRG